MSVLKYSPVIDRMLRQDAMTDLGEPTRPFLEAAVEAGDFDEATRWLDYFLREIDAVWYIFGVWDWYMVRDYLDRKSDATWQGLVESSMAPWVGTTAGLRGEPVAEVAVDGPNAELTVPGLEWPVHLTEGDERFDLSLDSPDAQTARWAERRASLDRAIRAADVGVFGRLLDIHVGETRLIHDIMCDWAWALPSAMMREWGEEALGHYLRATVEPWVTVRYDALKDMGVEELMQLTIEGMRGHFTGPGRAGAISVDEESDRYVLSFDACGTGGRMRRGDELMGSGSRLGPPYHFLNVERAYDWTWDREGVCAYCAHCAVVNQILPIESIGRPMRLTEYPENADDPCRWIIYKDLDGFPDEAFTKVGKARGAAR